MSRLCARSHHGGLIGRNASTEEMVRHDWINRPFIQREEAQSQPQTMAAGLDFMRRNRQQDNWFLQIEAFDPHEPFFSHRKYKDLYAEHYDRYRKAGGKHFDWPFYRQVKETPLEVEHARVEYAALVSMCDAYLGDVLDTMDELDLWKDTLLVVWTDHGYMLGEHDYWAKNWMPWYEELSHTPFFVWDPRCGKRGERRQALVQPAIDLPLTLLDYFGVEPTSDMLGKNLTSAIARDEPVREAAIYGIHGAQVNVTDGRYTYYRSPATKDNGPIYEYGLWPVNMLNMYSVERLQQAQWVEPRSFTKGCRLLRVPIDVKPWHTNRWPTALFDLQSDPKQLKPLNDPAVERQMTQHLIRLMKECDAPSEQYERLGLLDA